MADSGQGRKKTISKAGEAGKEAEVCEHEKRIFKKRVSCFGCEAFKDMMPIEKVSAFQKEFAFLHDNRQEAYAEYMECIELTIRINSIEERLSLIGGNSEIKFLDDFQLFGKCSNCNALVRHNCNRLSDLQKDEMLKYVTTSIRDEGDRQKKAVMNFLALIIGKRNRKKLYNAVEKLFDIGAWPLKRFSSSGIDQRPYFNEDFAGLLSEEEATLLSLFDYKLKREDTGHHFLDLLVDLEKPFNELVDSFKNLLKEKQAALYKGLQKADGKPKTPPFETWNDYLRAYILKEKGVKANLLNPEWPPETPTRKKIAGLLFTGKEDIEYKLHKLDLYIRKAKKLINQANAFEGPFEVLKGKSRRKLPFTEAFPFLVEIVVRQENETNRK